MRLFILLLAILETYDFLQCDMRPESGDACVCPTFSNNCNDPIEPIPELKPNDIVVYETKQSSSERIKPFILNNALKPQSSDSSSNAYIFDIDIDQQFQKIVGFGGALTDATFLNLNKLKGNAKEEILQGYYAKYGIEYSTGRIPIGSTDFSLGVYSYCDKKDDFDLTSFSIDVDRGPLTGNKLANAQRILEIVKLTGKQLRLFASPWAPPAWMTDTGRVTGNPRLPSDDRVKASYVQYLAKFFEEYAKEGIHFWGMTVQNEPDGNLGKWQSLRFSPEQYRDFVRDHLGPVFKTRFPKLKLMMHDDQRYAPTNFKLQLAQVA